MSRIRNKYLPPLPTIKRSALLLAVMALYSAAGSATTAILVWTPSGIYLATDSRVGHTEAIGTTMLPALSICKMKRFAHYYVAPYGVLDVVVKDKNGKRLGGAARYEPLATVRRVLSQSGGLSDHVKEIERTVGPQFEQYLRYARSHMGLQMFTRNVSSMRRSGFLIVGIVNGRATYVGIEFYLQSSAGDPEIKVATSVSRPVSPQNGDYLVGGEHEGIDEYLVDGRKFLETDISNRLIFLLNVEARKNPEKVGGPYSIILVSPVGSRWLQKGVCEESSMSSPAIQSKGGTNAAKPRKKKPK